MLIGLLTYHHSVNNGAMFQTYATVKALQSLGHEVIIVDIRQSEKKYSGLKNVIADAVKAKRFADARRFRDKYYPELTRRYYSVDELRSDPPAVDCLIVGSDQTWNVGISKAMAMAYFLDFGSDSIKRYSYASSVGVETWNVEQGMTRRIADALERFDGISVRERTGAKLLNEVFGIDASVCVDPSLLFDGYPELSGQIIGRNEIVCYKLDRDSVFFSGVRKLKEETGIPVRILSSLYPVLGLRYTYPPGIPEWIRRIAGAKLVITDSFHGVVLSILYHRSFIVLLNNNGKSSRILDLLGTLGLQNRICSDASSLSEFYSSLEPIDYSVVDNKLESLRAASWAYLKNIG